MVFFSRQLLVDGKRYDDRPVRLIDLLLRPLIDVGHVGLVDRNDSALVIVDQRRKLATRVLRRLRDLDVDSRQAEPVSRVGVG